jgi:hypothetical protein
MAEHEMQADFGGGRIHNIPVDYPSNSKKAKAQKPPPEKKAEKIITGEVIQRKKGIGHRFKEALLGDRGMDAVVETVVTDILVAAFKGMVSDAVSQASSAIKDGTDRFLYGETTRSYRTSDRPGGYISYNRVRRPLPEYGAISPRGRSRHDFNEVVLASRGEAEDVIDKLRMYISEYGQASVGDFYDFVGITGDFPDYKWGWTDLRTARVRPVRGGYLISLPRTQPLD